MEYETRSSTEAIKNAIWRGWNNTPLHSVCIETGVGGGKTFGAIHAIGSVPKFKNAYLIIFAPSAKVKDNSWQESVKAYNKAQGTHLQIILITTPESMSVEKAKGQNRKVLKGEQAKITPKKTISFEMLKAVNTFVNAVQPVLMIFDEVHKIKNGSAGKMSEMSKQVVNLATANKEFYSLLSLMIERVKKSDEKWTKKQKTMIESFDFTRIQSFIQKEYHWIFASINLSATLIGNNFYYDAVPYFLMAGLYRNQKDFDKMHSICIEEKNSFRLPPTSKHPEGEKRRIMGLNFKNGNEIDLSLIKNLTLLDENWKKLVYDPVETSSLLPDVTTNNYWIDMKKDRKKVALPQYQEKIIRNQFQINDEEFEQENITVPECDWLYFRPIEWQNILVSDKEKKTFVSSSVPYQLSRINSLNETERYMFWSKIVTTILNTNEFYGKDILAFYSYNIEADQFLKNLLENKIIQEDQIFMINGAKKEYQSYKEFKVKYPERTAIIVIQYVAGGAAIEFKNAYNALFLSYSPSPINMIQASGRNTRNGMQGIKIFHHYLNVENDIYDTSVRELLCSKMDIQELLGHANIALQNGRRLVKSYSSPQDVFEELLH